MNDCIEPRNARTRETRDLAFAAYAKMQGLSIISAKEWRKGNANEYSFTFDDPASAEHPDGRWDMLHISFANSEAQAYDASVRSLKKLCKGNRRRQ